MGDISTGEGRTVLFVSHDLSAISTLTPKSILLNNGQLQIYDTTQKVLAEYSLISKSGQFFEQIPLDKVPSFVKVELITSEGGILQSNLKPLEISFEINMPTENYENIAIAFQIFDELNRAITYNYVFDHDEAICRKKGINKINFKFNTIRLYKGSYFLRIHLANSKTREKFQEIDCCSFEVAMINQKEPEWGWQNNVCKYIDEGMWNVKF